MLRRLSSRHVAEEVRHGDKEEPGPRVGLQAEREQGREDHQARDEGDQRVEGYDDRRAARHVALSAVEVAAEPERGSHADTDRVEGLAPVR